MGRAHEVRAKTIAKTNAAKSALYNRASKEIYLAAKSGVPDPKDNLALRSAIEKWKAQHVTKMLSTVQSPRRKIRILLPMSPVDMKALALAESPLWSTP